MECVPCGKKFNGQLPYEDHMRSDKHKRKLQSYALLKRQSDAAPAINNGSITTDLHEVIPSPTFSGSITTDLPKNFHCAVCDILFNSPENFQWHSLTREHAVKVISGNTKNTLNCDIVSSSDLKIDNGDENRDQKTDGTRNEVKSDDMILDELDANKKPQLPSYTVCNVCDKQFSGPEPYRQHMESALHLKKAEMKNSSTHVSNNLSFSCETCNKVFSGQVPFVQHMSSEVHKKKILQNKLFEKHISEVDSSSVIPVLKTEENTLKISNSNLIFCDICNVPCSGVVPYEQHLNGISHLKNMIRAKQKSTISSSGNSVPPLIQCSNGENSISGIATNQFQLVNGINQRFGENKMEIDYILPEFVDTFKAMSTDELEKTIKFFKPDETIDFDISDTQMNIESGNEDVTGNTLEKIEIEHKEMQVSEIEINPIQSTNVKEIHDILEKTEAEAKEKQMDETEKSSKFCDLYL